MKNVRSITFHQRQRPRGGHAGWALSSGPEVPGSKLAWWNTAMYTPHQWRRGNAQNWKTGGARFKPRSPLSTEPFGDFRGFLRNSCKYGLGSLRKTPMEGTPSIGLSPTSGLNPTIKTKITLSICNKMPP